MSHTSTHRYAHRIRDLLALNLSHEKISRRLGMSVSNVGKIARQLADDVPVLPVERPPGFDPGNLHRCSGCGGMVYLWPCLTCERRSAEAGVA